MSLCYRVCIEGGECFYYRVLVLGRRKFSGFQAFGFFFQLKFLGVFFFLFNNVRFQTSLFFLIFCRRGKLWEFQKFRFYIYIYIQIILLQYNSYSYCDHTLCAAYNTHIRTYLHQVTLTCTQAGLKCSPNKASLNSLTSN